jgi:hypothetical protein
MIGERFGPDERIVQKDPHLTPYFPELAHLMPEAKFVFVIRDIRDVIASQMTHSEKTQTQFDIAAEIGHFVSTYKRVHDGASLLRNRILFVRYEALTCRPVKTLKLVYNFLGLPWTRAMEDTAWPTKREAGDALGTALGGQKINPSSVGRYRAVLAKPLIDEFDLERTAFKEAIGFDCYFEPKIAKQDFDCTFFCGPQGPMLKPADQLLGSYADQQALAI